MIKWIINALRTLVDRFRLTTTGSSLKPSQAGTDPEHPTVDDTLSGNSGHDDGASEEQSDSEHIDDENGTTGSSNTSPKLPSDSTPTEQASPSLNPDPVDKPPEANSENPVAINSPADNDQEPSLLETGGHSERDDPKSGLEPSDIGGKRRPRSPNQSSKRPPPSLSPCPELICRINHASMTWEIILSADVECQLTAVHLEDRPLDHNAHECCVPSLTGRLTISCQGKKEYKIPLFKDDPLIFKLKKKWRGEGRKISRITNGHFIVIAPATWEKTGRVWVEPPESCADTKFRAHYFYRDATTTNASVGGFREYSGSLVATGIELTGQRVFDDSDEGDLFVGNAPILKPSPEIKWARVGEETKVGWAQNFLPNEESLPAVLSGRKGRFFLRVYDSQVRLFDSMEFRYLPNLGKILVNGIQYTQDTLLLPKSTGHPPTQVHFVGANGEGHPPTQVHFVGANGEMISPILSSEISRTAAQTSVLKVSPNPDEDRISCSFGSDASGVKIVLDLPRIWWRLEDSQSDSGEWGDTLIVMTRQEFRKYAYSNAMLWLLSKRFKSVRAGFDDEVTQPYRRTRDKDRIVIPLADFVDYVQIDRRLYNDVYFNVEQTGEILSLIRISADPKPEVVLFTVEPARILPGQEAILEWTTRNAGDARVTIDSGVGVVDSDGRLTVCPTDTTKYTLMLRVSGNNDINSTVTVTVEQVGKLGERLAAQVMSTGSRWRDGKGFSSSELQATGLTVKEARGWSIPIDKRRRSSHRANTEKIRSMLDV